jgi:hypothetical protein
MEGPRNLLVPFPIVLGLSDGSIEDQITVRRQLRAQMVGQLYPSILAVEEVRLAEWLRLTELERLSLGTRDQP